MHRSRALIAAWVLMSLALSGCELIADFDRGKIPMPSDASVQTEDAGTADAAR